MRKDYTENQKQYQAPEMKVIGLENETELLAGTPAPGTSTDHGTSAVRGNNAIEWDNED